MKRLLTLLLSASTACVPLSFTFADAGICVGCSAPFEVADAVAGDGAVLGDPRPDAAPPEADAWSPAAVVEAGPGPEAATPPFEAAVIDAYVSSVDAYVAPVDAYVAPVDAYVAPVDAFVCTPIPAATPLCGGPGGISYVTPGSFCLTDATDINRLFVAATPSECQCAGQFTCACLEASSYVPLLPWCVGGPYPSGSYAASGCGCWDTPSGPSVTCDDSFVAGSAGQQACGS